MSRNILKALKRFLFSRSGAKPAPFAPISTTSKRHQKALVSYIRDAAFIADNSPRLNDHTSKWESKEIACILHQMGFDVDMVDYNDTGFWPNKSYDLIFDIHYNIDRLAYALPEHCTKILHITGSYPAFSIAEELKRVADLEKRHGKPYSPKRIVDNIYFTRSLEKADFCTLFGNAQTIATFPSFYQSKIHLVTPTATLLRDKKTATNYASARKGFLWFYGNGAVHKGLDLVLDLFLTRPDLELHVVGNAGNEPDFMNIYHSALCQTPNIHYHGPMNTLSPEFNAILQRVSHFIAPSCSESLSVAAASCLAMGLYPIISERNGIDLPQGCGITLSDVTSAHILQAIDTVASLSDDDFCAQIAQSQKQAERFYTRENFTKNMTAAIKAALKEHS